MARSLLKGPFCEIFLKKTNFDEIKQKKLNRGELKTNAVNRIIKIWSRRSVILPNNLNKEFLIYNGKTFIPLKVSEEMVGHKFGEFASTRKKPIHKKKRK